MRETISAVIMSYNYADIIEGTLKSVSDWVDEIIVIDGFSSDKTVDICKKYTDKIYQNKWDGHRFCTERNLGIQKATMDWCFHIDPDERATPELRDAILQMLQSRSEHSAYEFRKRNFFLGHPMKYGGWYHYSLHLFRRQKAHYEGIIHEKLVVDGTIGKLDVPLDHHPYPSIQPFIARHNGYSSREADMLEEVHGNIDESMTLYNIRQKPIKRFWKFYFKKKGILDGVYGLIFSVLYAWVHFLNWSKYWESKFSSVRNYKSAGIKTC